MSYELTEQDLKNSNIYRKADKSFRSYRRCAERNASACDEPDDEAWFERSQARAGLALTKAIKALAEAQSMTLSEFFSSERGLCPAEAVNVVTDYLQLLKARREELQELEERRKHLLGCIKGWEEF